jgi:hypothetical protein
MTNGSTINLALSALFDLCVPTLIGGRFGQTFPTDLIVPLSEKEKNQYADVIKDSEQSWKIASDKGIILFVLKQPYCSIITADGDPDVALEQFRSRLTAAGGSEQSTEDLAEGFEQVHGMIPVGDDRFVSVIFSAEIGNPNAGFYGSAVLVTTNG